MSSRTIVKSYGGSKRYSGKKYKYGKRLIVNRITRTFTSQSGMKYGKYKLKAIIPVTSTGGGAILSAIRLTTPDLVDGSSVSATDWTSFANLYDQYRVTSIKIKWTPLAPNNETTTTSYRPVYVFVDFDSIGLSPTNDSAIGYENCKVKNLYRPWTYFIRLPKMVAPSATNVSKVGWFDTLATVSTGAIYLVQNAGLTASTAYGQILVTYYISGTMRR